MTASMDAMSRVAQIAHEKDPDRFLIAMLAPVPKRESLCALIAFNHEIAKTRDTVSEPMLGQIRLQWWREAIAECYAGQPRLHEVVQPLHETITRHDIPRDLLDALIDIREQDLDDQELKTSEDLLAYARTTGGTLTEITTIVLSGNQPDARTAASHIGTAWALVGLMRALPFHLRQKRNFLPRDIIAKHNISPQDLSELRETKPLFDAVRDVCDMAREELKAARRLSSQVPNAAKPVLRLASLCESYLTQLKKAGYNPYSPRLAQKPAFRAFPILIKGLLGQY